MIVEGIQRASRSPTGKAVSVGFVILTLGAVFFVIRSFVQGDTPQDAFNVVYIDSESGKTFTHRPVEGETNPIVSPYSGKNTGVRAEPCYWTASGQSKKDPTWVLLNEATGKSGPTFCKDCGRLVVGHNPAPTPGKKPPPTKEEYMGRKTSQPSAAAPSRESRK